MPENPEEFIPTRRSLLTRLKYWDDQESWKDFFNTYWKLIYGVAIKSGLSDQAAQDVVQETVLSVAKKMHEFKYDPVVGSFKNWLLLIARRRIVDHLRTEYRRVEIVEHRPREGTGTAMVERLPDPIGPVLDQVWDEEWEKNLMDAAMQRVRRKVKAKQWQVFDCYVIKKWPVIKVTKTLGVSLGQVYLTKHRIARLIKKEIETLEKSMI